MAVLAAIEKPTAFLDREGNGFNPILAICGFCSSSYLVLSFWGDCCHIQRASGHRWYPGRYRMQELPTVPNVLDGDLPLWWPEYSGLCVLNPSFQSLVPPSPSMSPTLPQLLLASVPGWSYLSLPSDPTRSPDCGVVPAKRSHVVFLPAAFIVLFFYHSAG